MLYLRNSNNIISNNIHMKKEREIKWKKYQNKIDNY